MNGVFSLRGLALRLHRCVGLAIALFLTVAGLTGSVLAFQHDIDAWLNPALFRSADHGPRLSPDRLRAIVEDRDSRVRVSYLPLDTAPGAAAEVFVVPRSETDTSAASPAVDYDTVFVDPVSGRVLGVRQWGACCLTPVQAVPFLYRVHYSLFAGNWGTWLMGGVALLWLLDCFVGLYLTLPRQVWVKWALAWKLKPSRWLFDLHRAGSLWVWVMLAVLAMSGIALNLGAEVFRPVVSWFSPLKAPPEARIEAMSAVDSPVVAMSVAQALDIAAADVLARGWAVKPQGVFWLGDGRWLRVDHKALKPGLFDWGRHQLFIEAATRRVTDAIEPGSGSAGEVFVALQHPLHTGKAFGLAGQILICAMGLAVAALSVTGVALWARKRATLSAVHAPAGPRRGRACRTWV